jgi:predicted amidophosphoribosyltransferase
MLNDYENDKTENIDEEEKINTPQEGECPVCFYKITPSDTECPNCGYNLKEH